MALLFNWPRRTPYLNQLDRTRRDSHLACDRRCTGCRPYAPTIMRSFTAPAAIVAPGALGLCTDKAVPGGLCPVCRSGIVIHHRSYGLLCCKIQYGAACPSCGVEFDDGEEEKVAGASSAATNASGDHKNQRVKGQRTKAPKGAGNAKNKHQQDLLLRPQNVELTGAKKKLSEKKTDK
ncbi:uncharacterized protein LOC117292522 [Asterias rubens]|uniref:uncharacterized protein LOC117292522 n=1 Tax=Asterias rubens TaxID=7604 RepID=UPI001455427D|nr:uncharacterized protein LOC117292522 [Asterias rubens]